MNKSSIVWKTQACNPAIASVRYRCLLPALYLDGGDFKSTILEGTEDIDFFDNVKAIIFVKTFSKHDYYLANKAHQNGVPIILDLCDNIFVKNYSNSSNFSEFEPMSKLAAAIVTTGSELLKIIQQRIGAKNIFVIPDQVETLKSVQKSCLMVKQWRMSRYRLMSVTNKIDSFIKSHKHRFSYKKVAGYLRISIAVSKLYFLKYIKQPVNNMETSHDLLPTYKRVVWFGNHGASHSNFGMGSLLSIQRNLEEINKKIPIELLVISNNKEKFDNLIKPFSIKTRYKKWAAHTIFNDISESDVCVLPSYNDEFSLSKSPNRTLLALSLGVPVVATSFPAVEELSSCIVLDDWDYGLTTYLSKKERVSDDISKAKEIIDANFSGNAVAEKWSSVLQQLVHHRLI